MSHVHDSLGIVIGSPWDRPASAGRWEGDGMSTADTDDLRGRRSGHSHGRSSAATTLRESERRGGLKVLHGEGRPHLREGPSVRHTRRDGWVVTSADVEVRLLVSVVIPTYNEALSLPAVLAQIPASDTEVIVVDGRSVDDTVEVARSHRPDVRIVHEPAKGKGAALKAGFEAATGDIIVVIDADGSMSPGELPAFVDALIGGADVVKGSRCLPNGSSADLTLVRLAGNWLLGQTFNVLYGTRLTDVTYGYLAFWAKDRSLLMPAGGGFDVEAGMLTTAAVEGLNIVEVPCHEGRRLYGPSNLKPCRDGTRILRRQLATWIGHRRQRG